MMTISPRSSRLFSTLAVAALLASGLVLGSVGAAVAADPVVAVVGDLQSEIGCPGDWDPGCVAAQLHKRADGVYSATFDVPAGSYSYKVALDGTWDVNYGAGGAAGGANLAFTTTGGPVSFYFDPSTHYLTSSANGPVLTLPGSFQDQLGCSGAWAPDCMAAWLEDLDGDGTFTFSTSAIASGSYELKVAHNLGWDENYGKDGVLNGQNLAFSASTGKQVTFSYVLATHILTIEATDPPLPGTGQQRAHWVSENTLAWPTDLLPAGQAVTDASWALYTAPTGGLAVSDGAVTGGDHVDLALDPAGLTAGQRATFPALSGYLALHPVGQDRHAVEQALTGQLQLAQFTTSTGALTAFTGVQIPGVLDDLYAKDAADRSLGLSWNHGRPDFALWAPTAKEVDLLVWTGTEPTRIPAVRQADGSWTVRGAASWKDKSYLYDVGVYVPSTGKVEHNRVTDPYSVALTVNSTRSVVVDLADRRFRPQQWEKTPTPVIKSAVDRAVYELHVRDFSISDKTVPAKLRGTYDAFTVDSDGTRHLRALAKAGLNTVHLLPTFDIATIEENRAAQKQPDCDLASFAAASTEQQASIGQVADTDGFNWGYDPFHFLVPEGSYAVNPDGGARVKEFRSMVGALHADGLQVVLDQVFNHTSASGQAETSVLDRVVPGYYHRLNARGAVETSTCCQNVATEHKLAEKLMVDSVTLLARQYHVDGFRFDLMGHHSAQTMLAVRASLDALTPEKDGVDGSAMYLYGEGWNFGEVADNALFRQAIQGQLGGTGIGTFSDRLRDAVHGGSPVDGASTFQQGFGTGLGTDPNGDPINGSTSEALADLGRQTDLVKLGLAGNLRDFTFVAAGRHSHTGRRDRLPRRAGRVRRPAGRGGQLRRRPRQRDPVRLARVQAAGHHIDGRPGADEHAVARDRHALADAVVLARRHRTAALEVTRPRQLQLGRLVQPDRLERPGQQLRRWTAARRGERRQVADHEAAARERRAQALTRRHRRLERRGPAAAAAQAVEQAVPAGFRRPDREEGVLPGRRQGRNARRHRDEHRRPRRSRRRPEARRCAHGLQRRNHTGDPDHRHTGRAQLHAVEHPGQGIRPGREARQLGCPHGHGHDPGSHGRRARRPGGALPVGPRPAGCRWSSRPTAKRTRATSGQRMPCVMSCRNRPARSAGTSSSSAPTRTPCSPAAGSASTPTSR